MVRGLVGAVFGNGGAADSGPARPRGGEGVGEGVNRSATLVVEGSARVFGRGLEVDEDVVLDIEVAVDGLEGWGEGITGTAFCRGVGPDRGCG